MENRAGSSKSSAKSSFRRLCLYCGDAGHWAKECDAKTAPFLKRSAEDNLWRTPGGLQVCFAHNGRHGKCSKSATCTFEHICSLCGSSGHSAGTCPRHELFPIVTPLRFDRWASVLQEAGLLSLYSDVPAGIRDGFRCGATLPSLLFLLLPMLAPL
ncbi:hypothetical protein BD779DRAFT_1678146 [Infundibulicybe gibba]|nr:hypothetical protein BD779DRAFT_1678146 [Infundibulicybe gibba]